MATSKSTGPFGVLMGLSTLDIELHGVRCNWVSNGKSSSVKFGDGMMRVCYLDGKRSSLDKCLKRLEEHIGKNEPVILEGPLQL